jgi:hypothetical protein
MGNRSLPKPRWTVSALAACLLYTGLLLAGIGDARADQVARDIPTGTGATVTAGFDRTDGGDAGSYSSQPVSFGIPVTKVATGNPDLVPATPLNRAVVYSVALPGLGNTERLRVRANVAISHCNSGDLQRGWGTNPERGNLHSPCESVPPTPYYSGNPSTEYFPKIAARAYLTSSKGDVGGATAVPVGDWEGEHACDGDRHHCGIHIRAGLDLDPNAQPPRVAPPPENGNNWINVVAVAYSTEARGINATGMGFRQGLPSDTMELEGNCSTTDTSFMELPPNFTPTLDFDYGQNDYNPDVDPSSGSGPNDDTTYCKPISQQLTQFKSAGQLSVLRAPQGRNPSPLGSVQHDETGFNKRILIQTATNGNQCVETNRTCAPPPGSPAAQFQVIASVPVDDLDEGDVVDAYGWIRAADDPSNSNVCHCNYKFDHFVGTKLVLANDDNAIAPTQPNEHEVWLTPKNGTNCKQPQPPGDSCEEKNGDALPIAKSASVEVPPGDGTVGNNNSGRMYVNLVANATDKSAPQNNDFLAKVTEGALLVYCWDSVPNTQNPSDDCSP